MCHVSAREQHKLRKRRRPVPRINRDERRLLVALARLAQELGVHRLDGLKARRLALHAEEGLHASSRMRQPVLGINDDLVVRQTPIQLVPR